MAESEAQLIKQPLYVYDLPSELLQTLEIRQAALSQLTGRAEQDKQPTSAPEAPADNAAQNLCRTCMLTSNNSVDHRRHARSDWHKYNLRQKIRGAKTVSEVEFELLLESLNESLSGSGSDTSDSGEDENVPDRAKATNGLDALFKRQIILESKVDGDDDMGQSAIKQKQSPGAAPLVWFTSTLLPADHYVGYYRAILTPEELQYGDVLEVLRRKQLQPIRFSKEVPRHLDAGAQPCPATPSGPSIFMCMIGGGHFAGMIVSLVPRLPKHEHAGSTKPANNNTGKAPEQRQAIVLAHKTFHRYTTRRKQGGAQSSNDAAKGAAHSAGSSLRRYNEVALEQEIRALLTEWRPLIKDTQLIFVRATGNSNRRILFGPYEGQVLHYNDPRNRTIPFSTRRATQTELMRCFVELTRMKVSKLSPEPTTESPAVNKQPAKPFIPAKKEPTLTVEEQAAILHTSQITSLIRRAKAPALMAYLQSNELSPDYQFPLVHPSLSTAHTPTPLHFAASLNSSAVVLALLTKPIAHHNSTANPTILNAFHKPAYDLATERATSDQFRLARHILGENAWSWSTARIPAPLTRAEAQARETAERTETQRQLKEDHDAAVAAVPPLRVNNPITSAREGKILAAPAQEVRDAQVRGLSEAMKQRVERERRARAAEARFAKTAGS